MVRKTFGVFFLVAGFIIILMLLRRRLESKIQLQSQLIANALEKYIQEVAKATLEEGGTGSTLDGYQLLPRTDTWQFPKYPSRTVILPPEADLVEAIRSFISANEKFLREPGCWLGTWINPQTNCFYLDITTSCNELNEAQKMALDISVREGRRIVAIYNSKHKETVYL